MSYRKNTAGQKFNILAINAATGLPVTGDAANITAKISLDSGASASLSDTNPTELDATNFPGVYVFDLTQAETNGDVLTIASTSTTANVQIDLVNIYPVVLDDYKANTTFLATAINLGIVDGKVSSILTDTGTTLPAQITGVETKVDGIKTTTDQFVFTVANQVDANALTGGTSAADIYTYFTDGTREDAFKADVSTIESGGTVYNYVEQTWEAVAEDTQGTLIEPIADAVWDEAYAEHTSAGTFGKLMDLLRKANRAIDGEVSGTPTTTAFDTNLTGYTTGAFDSEVLVFVSGSLNGEARPILSYSSTNGRLTFEEPWTAAPSASDEFVILPYHVHAVSEIASGIWSESQSSYTTAGTFGNYLDAKVSEAGGGYTDGPIVGRVIQDGTTEATVTEGEVIKGIVLD